MLHESLLDVAFDDGPGWRPLCPYDEDRLTTTVLEDVVVTHPVVPETERPLPYLGHDLARPRSRRPCRRPPRGRA